MAGFVTDRWPACIIHNRIKHLGHCVEQLRAKRWPPCGGRACDLDPRKRLFFWEGGVVHARPSRHKGEREVRKVTASAQGHLLNIGPLCEQSEDVHHVRRTKGVHIEIE
jgi:hypothetical protein